MKMSCKHRQLMVARPCDLTAAGLNSLQCLLALPLLGDGWCNGVCAGTSRSHPGTMGGVHPRTLLLLSLQGRPGVPGAVAEDVRALLGQ